MTQTLDIFCSPLRLFLSWISAMLAFVREFTGADLLSSAAASRGDGSHGRASTAIGRHNDVGLSRTSRRSVADDAPVIAMLALRDHEPAVRLAIWPPQEASRHAPPRARDERALAVRRRFAIVSLLMPPMDVGSRAALFLPHPAPLTRDPDSGAGRPDAAEGAARTRHPRRIRKRRVRSA
jgi:hypothetical protein